MKKFNLKKVFKISLVAILIFFCVSKFNNSFRASTEGSSSIGLARINEYFSGVKEKITNAVSSPVPVSVSEEEEWMKELNLNGPYNVLEVVDGDTLYVDICGTSTKVRLIGVDTPESVHSDSNKNVPEGKIASDYTKALLEYTEVYLEFDVGQYDKYGRTLAYVYMEDGTMVNNLLIAEGMAKLMTVQPNVKYEKVFRASQKAAQEFGKGFWEEYFIQ